MTYKLATKKERKQETTQNEFLKIEDLTLSLLYVDFSIFEIVLLAKIMSLSNGKRGCIASNEWFCWYFNVSESTLRRSLKNLKNRSLISIIEQKKEMKGTLRHIFVNLKEYHSLLKVSLKKKNEVQKKLKNDSDYSAEIISPPCQNEQVVYTCRPPYQNEQVVDRPPYQIERVVSMEKPPCQIDTTTLSNCTDHPIKLSGSIIENNKDENLILRSGDSPSASTGLRPLKNHDFSSANFSMDFSNTRGEKTDEKTQAFYEKKDKEKNKRKKVFSEEEDDIMARGDATKKIQDYWESINPIRKYEYTLAHRNAAKQYAYTEYGNPKNNSDFYTDEEVIQYFNDRLIPLTWIEENCPQWWETYQLMKDLADGMKFLEEEMKKNQ